MVMCTQLALTQKASIMRKAVVGTFGDYRAPYGQDYHG